MNFLPQLLCLFLVSSFSVIQGKELEFSDQLPPCPAEYLTDCLLATDGSIWVASEGQGIYRLTPSKKEPLKKENWFDVSYYLDLGKDVNYYAIAEDKQGRIWAGTDNRGVFVFNGDTWKVYDQHNALPGERIFDIAVSPLSGDVAIATSGGVSIYQPGKENWLTITRAEGLAEDQIASLSYDGKGTLWAAYQCGGISCLSEKEQYRVLKTDQAPWYWDKENRIRQALTPSGKGLPSNLSNAVVTLKNGTVLLGTNSGLGICKGTTDWNYVRGVDYLAKNNGLWNVKLDRTAKVSTGVPLLSEDYVSCLAESKEGVWVGFRQKGAVLLHPTTLKRIKEGRFPESVKTPLVKSLLVLPGGSVYAATYGHGLVRINEGKQRNVMNVQERISSRGHPSEAPIPAVQEQHQLTSDSSSSHKKDTSQAFFWNEDWATKGDWVNSYGKDYSCLCGTHSVVGNDVYFNFDVDIELDEAQGPHSNKEGLFRRPHGDHVSVNPNVLFNPVHGARIAAEWTDNGEEYPLHFDGPDIWMSAQVPEGEYVLSLYFYNYQGREPLIGPLRDFLIEVRKGNLEVDDDGNLANPDQALGREILSRTRVKDFYGSGVYKTWILKGPGTYNFRILNNYSSDTMLNGIFLTRISLLKEKLKDILKKEQIPIETCSSVDLAHARPQLLSLCRRMIQEGKGNEMKNFLHIWSPESHQNVQKAMLGAWYEKQDKYPFCRSGDFFPFSPRTLPLTAEECEVIEWMGINWKEYLSGHMPRPELSLEELKEKISLLSPKQQDELREAYSQKELEKIAKDYRKYLQKQQQQQQQQH